MLGGHALAQPSGRGVADLDAYVLARVAHSVGDSAEALEGYRRALASAPNDPLIAEGAFTQAMAVGDSGLSATAAQVIEQRGRADTEVVLVLFVDAVRRSDWTAAERQLAALNRDEVLGFTAPILGAWIATASRRDDPLALLAKLPQNSVGAVYAAEHRPLLLLAAGQTKEGLAALKERIGGAELRADRLKLAGASLLARKGKRKDAIALLDGKSDILQAARRTIEDRGKLKREIATPAQGAAELFLRLAVDLSRQNQDDVALSFARLATFLVPEDGEAWIIASALLMEQDRSHLALAALERVGPGDLVESAARDMRMRLLSETGKDSAALEQAHAAARGPDATWTDWDRLGDVYNRIGRHKDAAEAYGRAIDALTAAGEEPGWRMWLSKGAALDQAGDWTSAREALEMAQKLGPREPLVLNYLGYAQLVRRENLEAAEEMIAQARRLSPDSGQITDSLGWARYLRGDAAGAIKLLERAIVTEPSDPTINEHLGDAYYSVGRRYEARYAWEAALVTAEEKDAARLRAKIKDGYTAELASP